MLILLINWDSSMRAWAWHREWEGIRLASFSLTTSWQIRTCKTIKSLRWIVWAWHNSNTRRSQETTLINSTKTRKTGLQIFQWACHLVKAHVGKSILKPLPIMARRSKRMATGKILSNLQAKSTGISGGNHSAGKRRSSTVTMIGQSENVGKLLYY